MLEADFERYYHLDLRQEFQAAGCRRLCALISGLPADAAVRRQGRAWSQSDELMAQAIERNDMWMRWLAVGQGRKPAAVPTLPPIVHPDRQTRQPELPEAQSRMSTPDEIRAFFGRLKGG